ncbi:hypothetical protein GLOIN_2v1639809 [Rhizophagus irregularis DAOM 181602=DAOM 197198]|uniref:Serine-enriched protein n=1 Tax=Rhizophagus irregularis (strain DAOM 181602 / DAOM 197198 / MUCL 43194) TaxID=747089 RepID=A0A2P4PRZ3_RHIID|nr:hypothetical protein GLOIN_2v1639809 [Rhizophagus irregularis DAOM 181602=DAOM 197198]POG68165.1 hypothetical protein GLOIN_2v1639809 [Rhizophagus irregularis DAOM 181602=DAOM 197198]|eukprot:XP_025175031.1 hypothetical protein GLOIN_2v1639809 [Rhizophagus irregularis DAOM 181602=DAOM 197198]
MIMNFLRILSSKYEKLLEEEDGDVTIIVGEEVNQIPKSFKAHSLILKTQCPWFKIALSKDWARKGEETIVIRKPNISTSTFEIILKYLYCGIISTSHTGKQILDILIAADELNLNEIFKHLQDTLLKSHYEWLQNNFFYVYDIILKHQEFKILQEYFQEIIDDKPDILFYSQDFVKMDKELLINLLKRDNLVMSEIDVWRKLIEWGIENSKISKPLISNWDVEDFVKLKTILDQCITSIRFNNISSNDFYFEVRPYEKILSEQMKEDLIRYHMTSSSEYGLLSSRKGVIDSNLITSLNATTLVKSIIKRTDKNYFRFAEIPYEFRLLLRGSQDGFNHVIFQSKCAEKGPTIVVMRISGSRKIIGGYNPATWKINKGQNFGNTRFINCTDSFIFSFNGAPEMSNIISPIRDYKNAIRYSSNGFTGPRIYYGFY